MSHDAATFDLSPESPSGSTSKWAFARHFVEMLLARNAKPDAQNRQGATALSIAARRGYAEVVRALLAKKADPNKADFTGRTPLAYARQSGKPAIEAMLRKAGARE